MRAGENHSMFPPNALLSRAELLRRNQMLTACANLDVAAAMPERVGDYYNLMPLDSSQANVPHKSRTFRYQTLSYKATHIRTNAICYLKRMMGTRERNVVVVVRYISSICRL